MLIQKIMELATINDFEDVNKIIFNMGQIKALCENYIANDVKVEENIIKEKPKTFAEAVKEVLPEEVESDDVKKLKKLLERKGDHMNLKFELNSRYNLPKYLGTVLNTLSSYGIVTMQDLMMFLDDYENYRILKYPMSVNKDDIKKFNQKFPLKELAPADIEKLVGVYDAANEYKDKTAVKILDEFLNTSNVRQRNAILRYGIQNVNQLYLYLKNNSIKEYRKIRGIGEPVESIYWLSNVAKQM